MSAFSKIVEAVFSQLSGKVVFLDDSNERHLSFIKLLHSMNKVWVDRVVFCNTSHEACAALKFGCDACFLDHDLNDLPDHKSVIAGMYGGEQELTGLDVCNYIVNEVQISPLVAVVHSWNPDGANAMRNALEKNKPRIQIIVERFSFER